VRVWIERIVATQPESTHRTQVDLLRQIGDPRNHRAWADFHRIYAPMIRSFLRRMGLTEADAEDAAQEILLLSQDALRSGKYDPAKGRFRAWLYGVARFKALAAHRNRRRPSRAQAVTAEDGLDLLGGLEDHRHDAERRIWDQEWRYALLAEALRHVRTTLGEKVYAVFVRYGVERRPVEEVAAELHITPSSVYVYKKRALDLIREWIAEYERTEESSQP